MKKVLLYAFAIALVAMAAIQPATAQKARFKTERSKVQKGRLPTNYVAPEDRTYAVYAQGLYAGNVEVPARSVHGWTRDESNPNMEAVVSLYGYRITPSKLNKQKKETRDDDGKVTKTWYEYSVSGSATGKATLYVYGDSEQFKYERKKTKAQLRREEEKKAKEEKEAKELADNPFLSEEDAAGADDDEGEEKTGEDTGLDGTELALASQTSQNVSMSVRTGSHRSSTAAYKEYRETQYPKLTNFRDAYPMKAFNQSMNALNASYGFSPTNYTVQLQTMKSDKHPDAKMWNSACQAAQTLFKGFRYNQSIDDAQVKFDPILAYFNEKFEAIPDNDRKNKRMKKAAFRNIVQVMYYLDRHQEIMTFCERQAESKVNGKSAERLAEKSRRQEALLAFHKLDACHFTDMEDVSDDDVYTSEDEDEDEEEEEGAR